MTEPAAVTKLRATIALLGDLATKSLHGELGTEELCREREERIEILHLLGYTLGDGEDPGEAREVERLRAELAGRAATPDPGGAS